MKSKYPIKKLIILNFWLTSYFILFGLITTLASTGLKDLHKAIVNSGIAATILLLSTFSNLGLLLFFENRQFQKSRKNKIRYLISSYSISFLMFIIVIAVYAVFISHTSVHFYKLIYIAIICFLINTLILAFQNYVTVHDAKKQADFENSQLKAANTDAANQLLRQQIHPHFLFNALNILKSLYKINPKSGEEYLIHLSDFLRASVSTNNNKVSPLKEELKLCEDYMEMQKIRFGNSLSYSMKINEIDLEMGFVPSFSIQPLLENAIKHNELTEETPLKIYIQQENDRIKVSNSLKPKKTSEHSTGSGLANLSERYRILANDEIQITEDNQTFSVSIKILYDETSMSFD
jgi:two-component system, LytTR family, sensor kinase